MGLSASRPFAIFGTTGLGWEGHGVSSAGVLPSFVCFFMIITFVSGMLVCFGPRLRRSGDLIIMSHENHVLRS